MLYRWIIPVILTSAAVAPGGRPINLSDIASQSSRAGFRTIGEGTNAYAGEAVCGAGDVNQDGIPDVLIGSSGADNGAGQAYLLFGKGDNGLPEDLADIDSERNGYVFDDIPAGANFGQSVAAAGDVNRDGIPDIVIGAPFDSSETRTRCGRVFVVFGEAEGGVLDIDDIIDGDGGFVIIGAESGDEAGTIVAGAGDVNADGFDDLLITAPLADQEDAVNGGNVYIVFGREETEPVDLQAVESGSEGISVPGTFAAMLLGQSAAPLGDVNGDGYADVVFASTSLNAFTQLPDERAWVLPGGEGGGVLSLVGERLAPLSVLDNYGGSGKVVGSAGDVNGDGFADIVYTSIQRRAGTVASAGVALIIFGGADFAGANLDSIERGIGGFPILGNTSFSYFGYSAAAAGDVNADGFGDILIGAPDRTGTVDGGRGNAYLIYGKDDTDSVDLDDVVDGDAGTLLRGISAGDNAGYAVSGVGDMNGDGLGEMVIGAWLRDRSASVFNSGEAYVVFSPEDVPESTTYRAFAGGGDAVYAGIGSNGLRALEPPDSRVYIDFDDGEDIPALVEATIHRSRPGNAGDSDDVLPVYWEITTERSGWTSAGVTFVYLDSELDDANVDEDQLAIAFSGSSSGPWRFVPTLNFPERNTIAGRIDEPGYFALVEVPTPERILLHLTGLLPGEAAQLDRNGDDLVDIGDYIAAQ